MSAVARREGLLPSPGRLLALTLACAPVVALLEAVAYNQRGVLEGRSTAVSVEFWRVLLPWTTLAVCAPFVLPVVARYPLGARSTVRAIAVNLVAVLVLPLVRIALLDAVQVAMEPAIGYRVHFAWLFAYIYVSDVLAFCAIAGVLHAARHARERSRTAVEAANLRAELATARVDALARQLQPHFLFNALNSAAMLVRGGARDDAVEVLARISGILRELLRDRDAQDVALEAEFALVGDYLEIERVRFSDRLHVSLDLEAEVADVPVPFLILQPLVENAIRHGVSRREGPAHIAVSAMRKNGGLLLVVAEKGLHAVRDVEHVGFGVGLRNTRERLAARYGEHATLELSVDDDGLSSVARIAIDSHEGKGCDDSRPLRVRRGDGAEHRADYLRSVPE